MGCPAIPHLLSFWAYSRQRDENSNLDYFERQTAAITRALHRLGITPPDITYGFFRLTLFDPNQYLKAVYPDIFESLLSVNRNYNRNS